MNKLLVLKAIGIGALSIVLLVPLGMIRGTVNERETRQHGVENEIAQSSAGPQVLNGPFLVIPYQEFVSAEERDKDGELRVVTRAYDKLVVIAPSQLEIEGNVEVMPRMRGIYKALLYAVNGKIGARFEVPANLGLPEVTSFRRSRRSYITLGISDVRGLQSAPQIEWDGARLSPGQGTLHEVLGPGIHAQLDDSSSVGTHEMEMSLDLLGMKEFSVVPVAGKSSVTLDSTWAHTSSIGRFLPRRISADQPYFPTEWTVSHLATNSGTEMVFSIQNGHVKMPEVDSFGVSFVESVDIYQQTERAMKYGFLFVGLTFAGFFLFELLKSVRIHPFQYGMVGLALAMFYLLLISLSEHMAFGWAYLIATLACIALIGHYLAHVLGSPRRGIAFAGKLGLLYALLFGLIRSEDHALVLGSVLMFALLALVMAGTRKLDWYALTEHAPTPH